LQRSVRRDCDILGGVEPMARSFLLIHGMCCTGDVWRNFRRFFEARGVSELSLGFASGGSAASVWQGLGFAPAVVIANGTLDALRQRTR
jgi:hypothetical protein